MDVFWNCTITKAKTGIHIVSFSNEKQRNQNGSFDVMKCDLPLPIQP